MVEKGWYLGYKWIMIVVSGDGVFRVVVRLDLLVLVVVPINTIRINIRNLFINSLKPPKTVLEHSKKKPITRAGMSSPLLPYDVVVPSLCPVHGIYIDRFKKKEMKKPYM